MQTPARSIRASRSSQTRRQTGRHKHPPRPARWRGGGGAFMHAARRTCTLRAGHCWEHRSREQTGGPSPAPLAPSPALSHTPGRLQLPPVTGDPWVRARLAGGGGWSRAGGLQRRRRPEPRGDPPRPAGSVRRACCARAERAAAAGPPAGPAARRIPLAEPWAARGVGHAQSCGRRGGAPAGPRAGGWPRRARAGARPGRGWGAGGKPT